MNSPPTYKYYAQSLCQKFFPPAQKLSERADYSRHNVMSVVRFKTHKSPCWEMLAVQLANIYPWHACSQSLFHLSVCQCKNGVTLK